MAIQVSKLKTFRIGVPVEGMSSEYPELKVGRNTKSLTGEMIVSKYKCKTWSDFFQKNPLKFPVEKTFYVYEVGPDGAVKDTNYVIEGQFQPFKTEGILGDDYNAPASDSALRSENTRLRIEVEKLHSQNSELHELMAERDEKIQSLQDAERKWYMEGKLPLELKVAELTNSIEKIKEEKDKTVQSLNDNWEAERQKNKAEERTKLMEDKIDALLQEKESQKSSLSGLQTTVAAIAPMLLSSGLDALERFVNKKNPTLIENLLKKIGGEPIDENPGEEVDPAMAFQTGQGQQ